MNSNSAVVEGEAPESDDDIDLSGQEATEDLYDDSYEDEQIDCDACEEVREDTNVGRNSKKSLHRSNKQSPSNVFSSSLSASSLRSLISSKSTASPKKTPTKYPGILHKQLREKNLSLIRKLTDIQTLPYRESTAKCLQLHEASERTLALSRESLYHIKKTKFNLITACSRLEDTLNFASSSQANWPSD